MHPLQHSLIGIVRFCVRIDRRVRKAAENFTVTWIGKVEPVRNDRLRFVFRIPEHNPLLCNRPPEEWHQSFAAFVRCLTLEAIFHGGHIFNAARFFVDQRRLSPVENFLPAESINRNQKYIASLQLGPRGWLC